MNHLPLLHENSESREEGRTSVPNSNTRVSKALRSIMDVRYLAQCLAHVSLS